MQWLAILISVAWAHGGIPAGADPFVVDGELVGGGMALGLMLVEDGEAWWVSRDAIDAPSDQFFRRSDGSILAASFNGLFVSDDGGCTWERGPLEARQVRRIRAVPGEPEHLVATLADAGHPGKLVESLDDGATWTDTGLALDDFFPRQIELHPTGWFVTGFGDDPVRQITYRSTDAGQTWAEPTGVAGEDTLLVGQSATRVFASRALNPGSRLLASDDGFETVEVLGEVALGVITTAVEHDGAVLALSDGLVAYRHDGSELVEVTFEADAPTDCLGPIVDGELWTCADVDRAGGPFLRGDGSTFVAALPFDTICPRVCPEGTAGHDANASRWVDVRYLGLGEACPDEADPPDEVDPCSCDDGSLALSPLLLLWRRRSAQRPRT